VLEGVDAEEEVEEDEEEEVVGSEVIDND